MKLTLTLIAATVLLCMNMLSFSLMKIDKTRAKAGQWRIRESTLFLVTALFGGLGGVLGMQLLRHKTRHWYFKVGFPLLLLCQLILLGFGAYALYVR